MCTSTLCSSSLLRILATAAVSPNSIMRSHRLSTTNIWSSSAVSRHICAAAGCLANEARGIPCWFASQSPRKGSFGSTLASAAAAPWIASAKLLLRRGPKRLLCGCNGATGGIKGGALSARSVSAARPCGRGAIHIADTCGLEQSLLTGVNVTQTKVKCDNEQSPSTHLHVSATARLHLPSG